MEIDLNEIERRANAATPGPWDFEPLHSEGSYGSGPDCRSGFDSYEIRANGGILLDTLNSDVASVSEEWNSDELYAWDETGKRNLAFVATANPAVVLELVRRLRAAERWRDAVIDQLDVMHITSTRHKDDPVSAVHDCMAYSVNLALDPATSEQVRALIEAEREACAKVCELAISDIGDCLIIGYDRHDDGINVCTNLAKRIRSRNEPPKGAED